MFEMGKFIKHVTDVDPKYSGKGTSAFDNLFKVLKISGTPTAPQMQKLLDNLTENEARRFKDALLYLVTEKSNQHLAIFKVASFSAVVEHTPTTVQQVSNTAMQYTTRHFRVQAKVFCITPKNVKWELGYIQSCDAMVCRHNYTDGVNSWEIDSLPVNDSSDLSVVPWYGKGSHWGNQKYQQQHHELDGAAAAFELETNDNFSPRLGAKLTRPGNQVSQGSGLVSIERDQSFTCWLAGKRKGANDIRPLRKVKWRIELTIDQGGAHDVFHDPTVTTPPSSDVIPAQALSGPTANGAQSFYYRPNANGNRVLV